MGTIFVLVVIAGIVSAAIISGSKHFKGESGCCGGGGGSIEDEKKLEGNVIGKKIVHIDGMHCKNCKIRVERAINKINGASAKVNLKKNIAEVSFDRTVSDEDIKQAVELCDYVVTSIENV